MFYISSLHWPWSRHETKESERKTQEFSAMTVGALQITFQSNSSAPSQLSHDWTGVYWLQRRLETLKDQNISNHHLLTQDSSNVYSDYELFCIYHFSDLQF